jgi:hypothetical protein
VNSLNISNCHILCCFILRSVIIMNTGQNRLSPKIYSYRNGSVEGYSLYSVSKTTFGWWCPLRSHSVLQMKNIIFSCKNIMDDICNLYYSKRTVSLCSQTKKYLLVIIARPANFNIMYTTHPNLSKSKKQI